MSLRVKTVVKSSAIEGLGLFADQDIPAESLVWEHDPLLDGWTEIDSQGLEKDAYLEKYYCYDKGKNKLITYSDDARYINHSFEPNLTSPNKYQDFASRRIKKGEELTCDYSKICDAVDENYFKKLTN